MASIIYLSSICRLCLNTEDNESQTGMFEITETIQNKFKDVAQQEIQLVEFLKCKNILKTKAVDVEYLDEAVEFVKMETVKEEYLDESGETKKQSVAKKKLITPKIEPIETLSSILEEDSIDIDDDFGLPEMEFADYAEEVAGHRPHIILHPSYLKKIKENKTAQSTNEATASVLPIKTPTKTQVYQCSKCEIIYENQQELDHHMIDHLFEQGPQKCEKCSTTFKTATHYKRHIKKDHKGQTYICNVCGNLYLSQPKLTCHLRTHNLEKRFACTFEDCTKAFRLKLHLQNHERTHTGERPFVCKQPDCNASFKQSYMLTLHTRKHEEHFPYSCSECSMRFTAVESLKNHEDNYHSETRPYKCTQCYSSFKRPEHLKIHTAYRHSNSRPFKCDLCDYSAPFRWDLADHFKTTHSNDRPHQCKFCDFTAKKINYLRYHMKKIHESIEVYTCDQCEETFEYCDQLNEHRKNHTIFEQLYDD
ncbi:unnamed protein product [Diamesa hyperborea]